MQQDDLDHVFTHTQPLWEELRGCRVFVTGGTGFFGSWLLPTFLDANSRLSLGAHLTILSRDPSAFTMRFPDLANRPGLAFVTGDVRAFDFPKGHWDCVIHAATDAKLHADDALQMIDVIAQGTHRALEFAKHCGAQRFLLTSSGAVYGRLPAGMTHVSEEYRGGPDLLSGPVAYAEGKRYAEALTGIYARACGFSATIARSFAVMGPYLPLDAHFALGNFIRDALRGGPIVVEGDGTPRRSYLYGGDLAIWLWTILLRGQNCRAYNMGSDEAISIAELAELVASCFPQSMDIQIRKQPTPGQVPEWYVPSIERAKNELQIKPWIGKREGILKTIDYYREHLGAP